MGALTNGKHYWLTPPKMLQELEAEFHFDYDPCPFPKPESFDGLAGPWGRSNYCNPPFGKGMIRWVRKAIAEKGQTVLLIPAPMCILELINAKAEFRSAGRVRFLATEDQEPHPSPENCILAILRGESQ
jgi:hypothetical protein